jgi:hypothetical protein
VKDLALPPGVAKTVQLYEKMQTAISACFSFDECKAIADQAAAIAAYHKQIKDDASMRQFLEIKMRAWRRIGEILGAVDTPDCETFAARARKIREAFKGKIEEMSDAHIKQALDVAALPMDFFETNVREVASISTFLVAYNRAQREQWAASPEGQEEAKRQAELRAAWEAQNAAKEAKQRKKADEERKLAEEEALLLDTLKEAHTEAIRADHKDETRELREARDRGEEVGVTLVRHDRTKMRAMVFLIKDSIHEALRQAAFDNRITMHAILREGLAMWFLANGYNVSMAEIDLRPRLPAKKTAKCA